MLNPQVSPAWRPRNISRACIATTALVGLLLLPSAGTAAAVGQRETRAPILCVEVHADPVLLPHGISYPYEQWLSTGLLTGVERLIRLDGIPRLQANHRRRVEYARQDNGELKPRCLESNAYYARLEYSRGTTDEEVRLVLYLTFDGRRILNETSVNDLSEIPNVSGVTKTYRFISSDIRNQAALIFSKVGF